MKPRSTSNWPTGLKSRIARHLNIKHTQLWKVFTKPIRPDWAKKIVSCPEVGLLTGLTVEDIVFPESSENVFAKEFKPW